MAESETGAPLTLHLHIGSPKTGTSTIQSFLALNRQAFLDATGVYYPQSRSDKRASRGQITSGNGAEVARSLRSPQPDGLNEAMALVEPMLAGDHPRLLISSEGFYAVRNERFEAFASALAGRARLQVIFYARPQLSHVESGYLQVVGSRGYGEDIRTFFESDLSRFQPGAKLRFLRDLLGPDAVTVRKYDRKRLVGADIAEDFLAAFGGSWGPAFVRPTMVNAGMDAEHYLYARMVSSVATLAAGVGEDSAGLGGSIELTRLYAEASGIQGLKVMDHQTARLICDACESDNRLLDELAPEARMNLHEDNMRELAALAAAEGRPLSGLSRLELLLLRRLVEMEGKVARLEAAVRGSDDDGAGLRGAGDAAPGPRPARRARPKVGPVRRQPPPG